MPISKTKCRMNSGNGSDTTSRYGGPARLVHLDSFEEVRLALAYGCVRFGHDEWHLVDDAEEKYFRELMNRICKRRGDPVRDGSLVFMAEI